MPKLRNSGISLLGCTFEMDKKAGLFKIGKIYPGENWHKNSRSPLTEPGIKAAEENYILAINGKELKAPMNPYSLLVKTMGKIVTLKLNSKPEDEGSWEIKIKPVASESQLKYLDWVETNRRMVDKATNGRVGYLHMSNMSFEGLTGFVKDWYHQLKKDGIIIDDRYNGGGFLSQTILERLRRVVKGIIYTRWFGDTGTIPPAAYSGHLVLLMNRMSASDGDIFPYFFREYGLGKIIGMRTWGGVVGIYGMTPLMDGGYVTTPTVGLYSTEGEWIIEGIGVTPDIEIDRSPEEMVTDVDSQLKKAIEVIMKQIKEKPFKFPSKPADPVKN
jgi:tricorn protease